ncbi:MAG: dihydroorotate dehydrogenase electron transfer subunit [Candidatus Thorarchaeota archaeon]
MMEIDRLAGSAQSVRIAAIRRETDTAFTLEFDFSFRERDIHAGEFLMIWIPTVDEIPMSVSSWNPPIAGITVKAIGDATSKLTRLEKDDWIGIRGPFGNHFKQDARNALVVGGGIGIAPLRPLVLGLLDDNRDVHLVVGARTAAELILYDFEDLRDEKFHLLISTDDGTAGRKGFATDIARELIEQYSFDKVYTCGPEVMMAKLHQIAKKQNIRFEASLERYMKCGCGICGTCGMDPCGELVCIDGPIFSGEQLDKMSDFGHSYRDSTGQKIGF